MKRLSFLQNPYARCSLLGLMVMSAAVACGSIDDPTKARGTSERLETISGALSGTTVPANAHVALVWKVGAENKWSVLSDVPVVNGSFTMNLTPPPANYFVKVDQSENYDTLSGSGGAAPTAPRQPSTEPAPPAPKGGKDFKIEQGLSPRDTVSGTTIKEPLSVAMAGFVVYVDKNNNGKLDLDNNSSLSSPDELIGGNRELLLVNFKEGGALDYEKLRDKSGILPHAGYNLAWADEERWLPLNVVELKISDSPTLPRSVCDRDGVSSTSPYDPGGPSSSGSGGTATVRDGGVGDSYFPLPGDPNLECSADGRSFQYHTPCTPPPPPPPQPKGLCNSGFDNDPMPYACSPSYSHTLMPNEPVPAGWPCPVTVDGGSADGGFMDSGIDSGIRDGGGAPDAG